MQPKNVLDRLLLTTLALENAVDAEDMHSLLRERDALLTTVEGLADLGPEEREAAARVAVAEERLLKSLAAQRTLISSSIGEAMRGREAVQRYSGRQAA